MFIFLYFLVLFFIMLSLFKILNFHLFNEAITFSILSNYLLIFSTFIFIYYFNNYIFSLISSFFLILFSLLLTRDFKKILGYIPIFSIIYFLFNIYIFITCL